MELLKNLNKEQYEAVTTVDGPLLILAGAGSGKTRVLTHRISYLITEKNVHPSSILAITFTNKAAKEMLARVDSLIGSISASMWITTFHSACVRILRKDIEKLDYDKSFAIFDSADQKTLVNECIKQLNYNEKNFPVRSVIDAISKAKDELLTPEDYKKKYQTDYRLDKMSNIYSLYQKKLKESNALDFDDIIFKTIILFEKHPDVLNYYQNKFKYVLVDEYQDTNMAQYHLISLLSAKYKNLCVVGDDDQSIYGWRGANVENILTFEKEYKLCKVVKLEQNYRSTQNILDAANSVVANNTERKKKKLWTDNDSGELITWHQAENEHGESAFVSHTIKSLKKSGKSYSDIAVLYRLNAQSRVLEDTLMKEGIPYKIVGGHKFYDRKEIKDIIAYLRLIQNPSDNFSLKRIINVPKRGIGNTSVDSIEQISNLRGCSMFSIVSSACEIEELKRPSARLIGFAGLISKLRVMLGNVKLTELISQLNIDSGMLKEFEDENTIESQTRIENIKEFVGVAKEFEANNPDLGLEDFLSHISLVSDLDNVEEGDEHIVLMTIHSAKGLEFPIVFTVGLEEGVFPSYRSIADPDETALQEERRLCYVAITRAMEHLYLTNAHSRTLFGNTTYNKVSRFLREIPESLLSSSIVRQKTFEPHTNPAFLNNHVNNLNTKTSQASTTSFNPFNSTIGKTITLKQTSSFDVGDKVSHKKFGIGKITKVEPENNDLKLEITFEQSGMKRLMAAFANLSIVEE